MIPVDIFIVIITTITIAITSQTDRMLVSNNIGYRYVYDQKDGVIFDLSYEKDDDEVEYIEEADKGEEK